MVRTCVTAYRERMRTLARMRELDVWYTQTPIDNALQASVSGKAAEEIRRAADKARSRDSLKALSNLTRVVDGRRRLVSDPPLLIPIDELVGETEANSYEQKMVALIDAYHESLNISVQLLSRRFATREWLARSSGWEASACGPGWC